MKYEITCKKCKGKGKLPLTPALAVVMRQFPGSSRFGLNLAGIRGRLLEEGIKTSSASLSMRLAKLVAHGLLKRTDNTACIIWSRK